MTTPKTLTVFKLVMMSVVAIDSLKTIAANAHFGSSLLLSYVAAILLFFIPSALVIAELATMLPHSGGVYIWVREAFGKRWGFLVVCIQWMNGMLWYPAILSFIVITLASLNGLNFLHQPTAIFIALVLLFIAASWIIAKGIKISSFVSTVSAIIGVIIPMLLITSLGLYWVFKGYPVEVHLSDLKLTWDGEQMRLLIILLYSLMGMEVIAAHAGDVRNPKKDYPKAIFFASILILLTVVPASYAIALVVPQNEISLLSGVIDSFAIFLKAFHLEWLKSIFVWMIGIGSFGIFFTWLLNATRCFTISARDMGLPAWFQKEKSYLILQACSFVLISAVFVFMPSIEIAFWFLSAACAQLALLNTLLIFIAALKLRRKWPDAERPFRVGNKSYVLWIVCLVPMIVCFFAMFYGFLPPEHLVLRDKILYECLLVGVIIFSVFATFWVGRRYGRCLSS